MTDINYGHTKKTKADQTVSKPTETGEEIRHFESMSQYYDAGRPGFESPTATDRRRRDGP